MINNLNNNNNNDKTNNQLKRILFKSIAIAGNSLPLSNLNKIDEDHGVLTIKEIRDGVNSIFENYNINFCYLFGSYAKNEAYDKSDIDLLIDTDVTGLDFYGLIEDLRSTLNKRIDLLNINKIVNNEDLLREIMKTGVKIYG